MSLRKLEKSLRVGIGGPMKLREVLSVIALLFSFAQANADESALEKSQVEALQSALSDRGYYHGPTDGVLDSALRQSISDFQHDVNLQETGDLDQKTARRLRLEFTFITRDKRFRVDCAESGESFVVVSNRYAVRDLRNTRQLYYDYNPSKTFYFVCFHCQYDNYEKKVEINEDCTVSTIQ